MEPSRFRPRLDYTDQSAFRGNRFRGMCFMFSIDFFPFLAWHARYSGLSFIFLYISLYFR